MSNTILDSHLPSTSNVILTSNGFPNASQNTILNSHDVAPALTGWLVDYTGSQPTIKKPNGAAYWIRGVNNPGGFQQGMVNPDSEIQAVSPAYNRHLRSYNRYWKDEFDDLKALGFNSCRVLVSSETVHATVAFQFSGQGDGAPTQLYSGWFIAPNVADYNGKTPWQFLMTVLFPWCVANSITWIVDWHQSTGYARTGTWVDYDTWNKIATPGKYPTYDGAAYSVSRWVADLAWIATQMLSFVDNCIGIELFNEPANNFWAPRADFVYDANRNPKTYDDLAYEDAAKYRYLKADWETAAAAILAANPNLLIFVQGEQNSSDCIESQNGIDEAGWGVSFRRIINGELTLNIPANKVVWTSHIYGPTVSAHMGAYYWDSDSIYWDANNEPRASASWRTRDKARRDHHFGSAGPSQMICPTEIGGASSSYKGKKVAKTTAASNNSTTLNIDRTIIGSFDVAGATKSGEFSVIIQSLTPHFFSAGDVVSFQNIVGMTQLNKDTTASFVVSSSSDIFHFTITTPSNTGWGAYSSGGLTYHTAYDADIWRHGGDQILSIGCRLDFPTLGVERRVVGIAANSRQITLDSPITIGSGVEVWMNDASTKWSWATITANSSGDIITHAALDSQLDWPWPVVKQLRIGDFLDMRTWNMQDVGDPGKYYVTEIIDSTHVRVNRNAAAVNGQRITWRQGMNAPTVSKIIAMDEAWLSWMFGAYLPSQKIYNTYFWSYSGSSDTSNIDEGREGNADPIMLPFIEQLWNQQP